MKETDELKKGAEKSRAMSQLEEIGNYLHSLTTEIEYCMKRERHAWTIYLIVWLSWVAVGFTEFEWAEELFQMFFIFAIVYTFYWSMRLRKAMGEFSGALKILEILGMLPPSGGDREERKRDAWNEGVDMVKSWFTTKKKAQEKVFAPA